MKIKTRKGVLKSGYFLTCPSVVHADGADLSHSDRQQMVPLIVVVGETLVVGRRDDGGTAWKGLKSYYKIRHLCPE